MSHIAYFDVTNCKIVPDSALQGWDGYVMFDAYTATTKDATPTELLDIVCRDDDEVIDGLRGFHFFENRIAIQDKDGNAVGSICYGGERHKDRVMLEVKGYRTTDAVRDLRTASLRHRCTRVDSKLDFECPKAFETLLEPLMAIKRRKGLYGEPRGDWEQPDLGRTQYVGAVTSAARVRLYEKGKEPTMRHLQRFDLSRLEIQCRPEKVAKDLYSIASPLDVWGAAEWTRELAGQILAMQISPLKAQAIKNKSVEDAKLDWMCRQYGGPLLGLIEKHQGDLAQFGADIMKRLHNVQSEQDALRTMRASVKAKTRV